MKATVHCGVSPTSLQPAPEVHGRALEQSQNAVINGDDVRHLNPSEKPYIALMDKWTKEVLTWSGNTMCCWPTVL